MLDTANRRPEDCVDTLIADLASVGSLTSAGAGALSVGARLSLRRAAHSRASAANS